LKFEDLDDQSRTSISGPISAEQTILLLYGQHYYLELIKMLAYLLRYIFFER